MYFKNFFARIPKYLITIKTTSLFNNVILSVAFRKTKFFLGFFFISVFGIQHLLIVKFIKAFQIFRIKKILGAFYGGF